MDSAEVYYGQEEAHARVAEFLGVDSFDGHFDGTEAGDAYESGDWKCLECQQHEIEIPGDLEAQIRDNPLRARRLLVHVEKETLTTT